MLTAFMTFGITCMGMGFAIGALLAGDAERATLKRLVARSPPNSGAKHG